MNPLQDALLSIVDVDDPLHVAAMRVHSCTDFASFVDRLVHDFSDNAKVWQNRSVPHFLQAVALCSRRSDTLASVPAVEGSERLSWSLMARLLLGASVVQRPKPQPVEARCDAPNCAGGV